MDSVPKIEWGFAHPNDVTDGATTAVGDFVARKAGVVVLLVVWIVGIGSFCARPTHFLIVTPSVRRVASVARTVVITVQDLLLREAGRVVEVALFDGICSLKGRYRREVPTRTTSA
jgi:hypothetical protein